MSHKTKQAKSIEDIEDIENSINISWADGVDKDGNKVSYGSCGMVEFKIDTAGLYHRILYTLSDNKWIYTYKTNSEGSIEQRIQELKDGARHFLAFTFWSILNESKNND